METEKDATQQYTFRIPIDLKAEIARIAIEDDRSISRQVVFVLREIRQRA